MSDYISCSNGHYFNKSLEECPFCKSPESIPGPAISGDDGKTVIDKPKPAIQEETKGVTVTNVEDRTRIVRPVDETHNVDHSQSIDRRIVGWLVTFDDVVSGVDYRIREGQNPVGRNADCKIRVANDPEMSGQHGMLLFREGSLYFRDEMASNATLIDGVAVGPGQTVPVKDGAHIRLGSYTYLYRAAGV